MAAARLFHLDEQGAARLELGGGRLGETRAEQTHGSERDTGRRVHGAGVAASRGGGAECCGLFGRRPQRPG